MKSPAYWMLATLFVGFNAAPWLLGPDEAAVPASPAPAGTVTPVATLPIAPSPGDDQPARRAAQPFDGVIIGPVANGEVPPFENLHTCIQLLNLENQRANLDIRFRPHLDAPAEMQEISFGRPLRPGQSRVITTADVEGLGDFLGSVSITSDVPFFASAGVFDGEPGSCTGAESRLPVHQRIEVGGPPPRSALGVNVKYDIVPEDLIEVINPTDRTTFVFVTILDRDDKVVASTFFELDADSGRFFKPVRDAELPDGVEGPLCIEFFAADTTAVTSSVLALLFGVDVAVATTGVDPFNATEEIEVYSPNDEGPCDERVALPGVLPGPIKETVEVFNPTRVEADVTSVFFDQEGNETAGETTTIDPLRGIELPAPSERGTLRVTSSTPIVGRILAERVPDVESARGRAANTVGALVPAFSQGDLARKRTVDLGAVSSKESEVTYLVFNRTDRQIRVRVIIRRGPSGDKVVRRKLTIEPFGFGELPFPRRARGTSLYVETKVIGRRAAIATALQREDGESQDISFIPGHAIR